MNVLYNIIVYQVGHLPRVLPRCTVSKTQNFSALVAIFLGVSFTASLNSQIYAQL